MQASAYPKRPPFFAYRFCRLMAKTALANEIGPDACYFLSVIVMTEDAKHYRGPVSFFNEQVLPLAGIGSVPALLRVRERCVKAGWLHYTPGTNRRAATYYVMIPDGFRGVEDGPLGEESDGGEVMEGGASANGSTNKNGVEPLAEAESKRNRTGIEPELKRRTIYPVPCPSPSPTSAGSAPAVAATPETSKPRKPATRKPRPRNELFDALAEVTGSDPAVSGAHVGKVASLLASADTPYTPAEVREFARRFHELCPWARDRARPTLGEFEKFVGRLRDAPAAPAAPPAPRIKRPEDNPFFARLVAEGVKL